jgi:hypothetical protein
MHVAVVIPCYNERDSLPLTCASLGFGVGTTPPVQTILVLIDNNSTDGTLNVAEQIARESPPGSVYTAQEREQGYVPPRRAGNLLARDIFRARGIESEAVLVVQADADTDYSEGYVDAMRDAAGASAASTMLQCIMTYPPAFLERHAGYVALCERAEHGLEWLFDDDSEQVVVDDKAVAYNLAEYFRWGGHQREYARGGDEVHAETTRLYMRGRSVNATIQLVDGASAMHSVRRVLSDPAVDFATAGFPREASWLRAWREVSAPIKTLEDLAAPRNRHITRFAADLRRKHTLALFGLLPLHVARALGERSRFEDDQRLLGSDAIPMRNRDTLRSSPALFIEDAFTAQCISEDPVLV